MGNANARETETESDSVPNTIVLVIIIILIILGLYYVITRFLTTVTPGITATPLERATASIETLLEQTKISENLYKKAGYIPSLKVYDYVMKTSSDMINNFTNKLNSLNNNKYNNTIDYIKMPIPIEAGHMLPDSVKIEIISKFTTINNDNIKTIAEEIKNTISNQTRSHLFNALQKNPNLLTTGSGLGSGLNTGNTIWGGQGGMNKLQF